MPKAAILVGIAGSKRKFIAGRMSELCFYLRIDGREISEVTSFAPHWQILSALTEELHGYASSVEKQYLNFLRYSPGLQDELMNVREFVVLNGWCNCLETGNDIRCQPLPIEAIEVLRGELISRGFKEVRS